ncbi:hypothetical protein C8R45DRAFT_933724 [Mycena sanguinolenta]|nr:hypothetical protein C8R45DRAFT_933724 [Mycena sanguinolenta]
MELEVLRFSRTFRRAGGRRTAGSRQAGCVTTFGGSGNDSTIKASQSVGRGAGKSSGAVIRKELFVASSASATYTRIGQLLRFCTTAGVHETNRARLYGKSKYLLFYVSDLHQSTSTENEAEDDALQILPQGHIIAAATPNRFPHALIHAPTKPLVHWARPGPEQKIPRDQCPSYQARTTCISRSLVLARREPDDIVKRDLRMRYKRCWLIERLHATGKARSPRFNDFLPLAFRVDRDMGCGKERILGMESPTESMTEGSISGPSTDDINNLLHLQRRDFLQNTGTSALHNWNGKAGSAGEIFHNFQHHPLSTKLKSLQMTASYPYVSRNLLGEGGSERGVRIVCSALKFLRMTNLPRVSVAINLSLTPECYIGKIFACMTKDVGLPNGSALRERLGAHGYGFPYSSSSDPRRAGILCRIQRPDLQMRCGWTPRVAEPFPRRDVASLQLG